MNLLQLKWYAVESSRKNPTLHNEIYDIVNLAISEIEEGGSEDHECSLAQREIEFMVNELLNETEMQKINSPGGEETVHGYVNEETYTMISHIHNNQEWLEDAFKNIRQYDNPIRLGVFFTELVFKSDDNSLKDSFGRIAFSNINWFEIYENLKEMMPKVSFEVGDYLMIVDGDDLTFDWKGKVFVFDSYDGNEEGAIDITDHSGEDVQHYQLFEHRFVKVYHEYRFVEESDRWISEWREELSNDVVAINYFQGHDSFNDLQEDFFLPDPKLTEKVLDRMNSKLYNFTNPLDDAIWSVHFEENVSKEELIERLALANGQAKFLFDLLHKFSHHMSPLGDKYDLSTELFYSHNIKVITDITTDEYKFDK